MDDLKQEDTEAIGNDPTLLLVDDDKPFLQRLARAMESRGFQVTTAESVEEGIAAAKAAAPAYAVVDMRLGDGNGLDIIEAIRSRRADTRAIVLTGYGNIATAVNAVKLGAIDYLSKPADADEVFAALTRRPGEKLRHRKIRCPPTASAGNISSASMKCASVMFPRRHAVSTCIAVHCSASWRNALRVKF